MAGRAFIEEGALEQRFVRSSGPGGQHVNTSSTAVQLRYDLRQVTGLPMPVLQRLRKLAGQRLTDEDVIVLESQQYRSQERNRRDVRERLLALLEKAWEKPRPRIATRPSKGAKRRRMEGKTKLGAKKRLRKPPTE
ncbi:MAG: alternative ribosome rescue aminoacyl-tRNA hydrolase ArfB [Aquisalimonadaceae bacterium]